MYTVYDGYFTYIQIPLVMKYFYRSLLTLFTCLGFFLLSSSPSLAAKLIVARYGFFERTLNVSDIRHFAETKETSNDLEFFLSYLEPKQRQQFQDMLQIKMSLDIAALDKLVDTEAGQKLLRWFSQITVRNDQAGITALQAAGILGASSKEGLGIITFLEAYPSERIVFDLSKSSQLIDDLTNLSNSNPPQDNLISSPVWDGQIQYQILATQNKQYSGCLFGDSVSAELGNTLGKGNYNFGLGGVSTISLVDQIQRLIPHQVKCQKAIIAIGGNDAWYNLSDELFTQKLQQAIALVRNMGTQKIYLIPAFYSTLAASLDPTVSAPLPKVEHINALINQIAAKEQIPVEENGIASLYENHVLKSNLTSDGDHLNEAGITIYRAALLEILSR